MKSIRRTSSAFIDAMEFTRDLTRLPMEPQYLGKYFCYKHTITITRKIPEECCPRRTEIKTKFLWKVISKNALYPRHNSYISSQKCFLKKKLVHKSNYLSFWIFPVHLEDFCPRNLYDRKLKNGRVSIFTIYHLNCFISMRVA